MAPTMLEDIRMRQGGRAAPAVPGGMMADLRERAGAIRQPQQPPPVDPSLDPEFDTPASDVTFDTPYRPGTGGESQAFNQRIIRRRISLGKSWRPEDDAIFTSLPPDKQSGMVKRMMDANLVRANYNADDALFYSFQDPESEMSKRVELAKLKSGRSLVLTSLREAAKKAALEGREKGKVFKETISAINPYTQGPVVMPPKAYEGYYSHTFDQYEGQKWLYDHAKKIVSGASFLDPKKVFKRGLTDKEKNVLIGFVQELSPVPEERSVFGKVLEAMGRGAEEILFTIPDQLRMLFGSEEERQLAHDAWRLRKAYYSGDVIRGENVFSQGLYDVSRMAPLVGASMATGGPIRATLAVWWPEGTMELYHDVKEAGVSDSLARPWAIGLGLAYGAVETLQLSQMGLGHMKRHVQREVFHNVWAFMWSKVKASPGLWTREMMEELVQGGIKIGNEAIVRVLDEEVPDMDRAMIEQRLAGLEEELKQAAIPLAYMMITGGAVQTVTSAMAGEKGHKVGDTITTEAGKFIVTGIDADTGDVLGVPAEAAEAPVSPEVEKPPVTTPEAIEGETAPVAPAEAATGGVSEPVTQEQEAVEAEAEKAEAPVERPAEEMTKEEAESIVRELGIDVGELQPTEEPEGEQPAEEPRPGEELAAPESLRAQREAQKQPEKRAKSAQAAKKAEKPAPAAEEAKPPAKPKKPKPLGAKKKAKLKAKVKEILTPPEAKPKKKTKPKPMGKRAKKKGKTVTPARIVPIGKKTDLGTKTQAEVNDLMRERNRKKPDHIVGKLTDSARVFDLKDKSTKEYPVDRANELIAKNLRKFLVVTPEFALDPTLTLNKAKYLVFRDGYKFTFSPEAFGVAVEGMKAGETVRIDLESFDIKVERYTKKAEVIAAKGFPQRKPAKPGKPRVATGSKVAEMEVSSPGFPEYARKAAERIRERNDGRVTSLVDPADLADAVMVGAGVVDMLVRKGIEVTKRTWVAVMKVRFPDLTAESINTVWEQVEPKTEKPKAKKPKPEAKPKAAEVEKGPRKKPSAQGMASQVGDPFSGPLRAEGPISRLPVGIKDIREAMSELFGVKIAKGRMRSKHAGFYKTWARVVRTKHFGKVGLDSHEVAHHIDQTTDVLEGLPKALRDELKLLDYEPEKRRTKEGFAEFFRHFLVDGDAQEVAPEFYEYFTTIFLPGADPHLQNAIKDTRRMIMQWQEEGAEARFDSQIDFGPSRWRKLNPLTLGKGVYDWFIREFVQKFDPIRQAEREITGGEKLAPNASPFSLAKRTAGIAAAQARSAAIYGMFDLQTGRTLGPSLRDILEPLRGKRSEFRQAMRYALAQHAVDVWEQGKDPGFILSDAQYILDKYSDRQDYKDIAQGLTEWHQWLMGQLVEVGGFPQEVAVKLRQMYPHFVSLMRSEYLETSGTGGKKLANIASPVKRLSGKGGGPVIDPVTTALIYAERFLGAANKIRVGRALIELSEKYEGKGHIIESVPGDLRATRVSAEDAVRQLNDMGIEIDEMGNVGDAMLTFFASISQPVAKDNVIVLWKGGKKKTYQVTKGLQQSLAGLDPYHLPLVLNWVLGAPAKLRRLGATGLNPGFSLFTNPWRDWFVASMQTEAQVPFMPVVAVRSIYHALGDLFGWSKAALLFRRGGGEMAQPLGLDRKMLKEATSQARAHGWRGKTAQAIMHPLASLQRLFSFTEAGTRLAEFTAIAKKNGWTPVEEGMEPDAMLNASESAAVISVDFLQSGRTGQKLNRIISFFNAPIQAVAIMGRNFKSHPVRTTLRGLANITIPTMILWWRNKDEEWYKDLPGWRKNFFWNFRAFGMTWSMPKPFEYGVLFGSIPEAFADQAYNDDRKAVGESIDAMVEAIMPPLIPTAIEGPLEIAQNRSFFTDRPIVSRSLENLPPSERYHPHTTETSKLIGDAMNMSPIAVDHLLRSYTGGLGLGVARTAEKAGRAAMGRKPKMSRPDELADMPIIGRLLMRENTTRVIDDFYKEREALGQEYAASNKRNRVMAPGRKKRLGVLNRVARELSKTRKRLREIEAGDGSNSEKLAKRKKLVEYMIRLVKKAHPRKKLANKK